MRPNLILWLRFHSFILFIFPIRTAGISGLKVKAIQQNFIIIHHNSEGLPKKIRFPKTHERTLTDHTDCPAALTGQLGDVCKRRVCYVQQALLALLV